jgi:hypothetical protein
MKKKTIQRGSHAFILHPSSFDFVLHPSSFMMSSHVEKVSGGVVAQSAEGRAPVEHAAH